MSVLAYSSASAPVPADPLGLRIAFVGLLVACALLSAKPYAGSWNDGSRLASVEAIVDFGSQQIDDSIFVRPPEGASPYAPGDTNLARYGTLDKLRIEGHFYTDKPIVISYLLAGEYAVWQAFGGPTFAERPDRVCRYLTAMSSGLLWVLAVCWMYSAFVTLGVSRLVRRWLTVSFAFSTVGLAYTQHVNNHVMLLGVFAGLIDGLLRLPASRGPRRVGILLTLGLLTGLGYNLDLGTGPGVVLVVSILVAWRARAATGWFLLTLAPLVVVQLVLNYQLGGVLKPVNSVPAYLAWEGSPFTPENLTGLVRGSPEKLAVYSLGMLFGKKGLFFHNLPMLLVFAGIWFTLLSPRNRVREWPELLAGGLLALGGWAMYSLFSNNSGGMCLSIRWFVAFLAPAFAIVARMLKDRPHYLPDLIVLTVCGMVLNVKMVEGGPWHGRMVPWYWQTLSVSLIAWSAVRVRAALLGRPTAIAPMPSASRAA